MSVDFDTRARNVTAVLGPTNTGKTHLAIERMLAHDSGMIGLPLRLLAREVYDKVCARVGAEKCALITGEEKIKPEYARYWVCTVEAMPPEIQTEFLAIDEIQLCADPDRGHVFTDRLLNARGKSETLLLGANTMRDAIADLIPGCNFITRPRLSKLTYAGEKKITRLPPRSAIVTFSANDVYAIAELVRRQRGGAAVVIGALSPRTRNAQVELFQTGQVDFLIATDAIGMGLNLDVDHIALAQTRKFDGMNHRDLTPGELAQIAGRAGRHLRDGTFGVTGGIEPLSADLVDRLENHNFDPIKLLQWRGRGLDFSSIEALRESLRKVPREARLQKARMADDVIALEAVASDQGVRDLAKGRSKVELLWDVCQLPDYRKISSQSHADMVATLYKYVAGGDNRIPADWFAAQVAICDRNEGDIDTLSQRLAHIRTWTYVANRSDWLKDATHWQQRTRAIEDSLSDALHEQLTQRFVDTRATAMMRGMRDKDEMYAEIADDGAVHVEKHFVGRLKGFVFQPESQADDLQARATRGAANHVVGKELAMRARRVASAKPDAFKINRKGEVIWRNDPIAHLVKGDDPLKPLVVLDADEQLTGPDKEKVQERLNGYVTETIAERLKSLVDIAKAEDVTGMARGIAFRMTETFGTLRRESAADELKGLDQQSRASLRKYGVRFGAFNVFFPLLLKPSAAELALVLRTLTGGLSPLTSETLPEAPKAGLTSIPVKPDIPEAYYQTLGFQVCGPRAVRIDMLERLADMIRPLLAFRSHEAKPGQKLPSGATGDGAFLVTPQMMSILGCSSTELSAVLESLGFRSEKKPLRLAVKQPPPAPLAVAPVVDATSVAADMPATTAESSIDGAQTQDGGHEDAVLEDRILEVGAPEASAPSVAALEQPSPEGAVETPIAVDAARDSAAAVVEQPTWIAPPQTDVAQSQPASSADPASAVDGGVPGAVATIAETLPVEEPMIDVWRPRRKHQGGPRQHRGGERRDGGERRQGVDGKPQPWRNRRPDDKPGSGATAGPRTGGERSGNERTGRDRRDRYRPVVLPAGTPPVGTTGDVGATPAGAEASQADGVATQRSDGARREGEHRSGDRGEKRFGGRDNRDRGDRGPRPPLGAASKVGPGNASSGNASSEKDRPRGPRDGDKRGFGSDRRSDDRRPSGGGRSPERYTAGPSKGRGPDPSSPFAALGALFNKGDADKKS